MQTLKQLIKEFRVLRENATQGEWVEMSGNKSRSTIVSYTGDSDSSYYPCAEVFKTNKDKNPKFVTYSANNITKLLDAVEILVEALTTLTIPDEHINTLDKVDFETRKMIILHCNEICVKALQQADEKVR